MISNTAWQRHGCYKLGSDQYFNMPLGKSVLGCQDDWNSLDHFDPTADSRRVFARFFQLRNHFVALQDGFNLVQRGNWTSFIQRPGSNKTQTEMGLWSASRSAINGSQTLKGNDTEQVWLLYSNENTTQTWQNDCLDKDKWMSSPFQAGTVVQNLFPPYEKYTLADSKSSYYNNSQPPYTGCMASITVPPFGFLALVEQTRWIGPTPAITKFLPGHDARLPSDNGQNSQQISFEFNVEMDCTKFTAAISLNMSSSGTGGNPTISGATCTPIANPDAPSIYGADVGVYQWQATLTNFPDGILEIVVNNPPSTAGPTTGVSTFSVFRYMFR